MSLTFYMETGLERAERANVPASYVAQAIAARLETDVGLRVRQQDLSMDVSQDCYAFRVRVTQRPTEDQVIHIMRLGAEHPGMRVTIGPHGCVEPDDLGSMREFDVR